MPSAIGKALSLAVHPTFFFEGDFRFEAPAEQQPTSVDQHTKKMIRYLCDNVDDWEKKKRKKWP